MGSRYTVSRTAGLSTTNDHFTIIAPSTRALKIWEIRVYGQGTSSSANEIGVYRSTGGTTGGGAITPTPLSSLAAAAGATVDTTWVAQPTPGVVLRRVGVNANGAYSPLVFMPGSEIDVPPSGQVSIRSIAGTSSATVEVVFEEVG